MMNIVLAIVQALIALHTLVGAIWKVTNSEHMVPSLSAIPHHVWLGLIGVELLASAVLILALFLKPLKKWSVIAASGIAAEMLIFCGIHFLAAGHILFPTDSP